MMERIWGRDCCSLSLPLCESQFAWMTAAPVPLFTSKTRLWLHSYSFHRNTYIGRKENTQQASTDSTRLPRSWTNERRCKVKGRQVDRESNRKMCSSSQPASSALILLISSFLVLICLTFPSPPLKLLAAGMEGGSIQYYVSKITLKTCAASKVLSTCSFRQSFCMCDTRWLRVTHNFTETSGGLFVTTAFRLQKQQSLRTMISPTGPAAFLLFLAWISDASQVRRQSKSS